jgi:Bacterial PH domain
MGTPWRTGEDGTTVFRMPAPLLGWWAWVVFAAVCLADLAVQGRDRAAVQAAVAVLAITGIMYACTLRPRVVADSGGLLVRNPLRDHRIPWDVLEGIYFGESIEFRCTRPGRKDKTVYSWALPTRRRARLKAEMRPRYGLGGRASRAAESVSGSPRYAQPGPGRMPGEASKLTEATTAEIIARELGRLRDQASVRAADRAPSGALAGRWAWPAVAAIVVPVVAFVLLLTIR